MTRGRTPDILGDVMGYGAGPKQEKPAEGKRKEPEGIRVNVYLNEPLLNRAKAFAIRRHWNTSLLIREALVEYLAQHDTLAPH
jgi:hypothetical protein